MKNSKAPDSRKITREAISPGEFARKSATRLRDGRESWIQLPRAETSSSGRRNDFRGKIGKIDRWKGLRARWERCTAVDGNFRANFRDNFGQVKYYFPDIQFFGNIILDKWSGAGCGRVNCSRRENYCDSRSNECILEKCTSGRFVVSTRVARYYTNFPAPGRVAKIFAVLLDCSPFFCVGEIP